MQKGVILVNMGGAESPKLLRDFLFRMFMDKRIIGAPKGIRFFIAYIISRSRYQKSWKKYELIGGTPILKAGSAMASELNKSTNLPVEIAYSYSKPSIEDAILCLQKQSVRQITVIPLYPQASYTTTFSVMDDIQKLKKKYNRIDFKFIEEFSRTDQFINYWSSLIETHINEVHAQKPTLIFAAHSIPQSVVDKGDTYTSAIENNAQVIAGRLGLEYEVTFQSKFGPVAWYGRDTKAVILDLIAQGKHEMIIVPISFISECLETIYDIDKELFSDLDQEIKNGVRLSRISIPYAHPLLIETLKSLL